VVTSPGPSIRVIPPLLGSWRLQLDRTSRYVATEHYSSQRARAGEVDAHRCSLSRTLVNRRDGPPQGGLSSFPGYPELYAPYFRKPTTYPSTDAEHRHPTTARPERPNWTDADTNPALFLELLPVDH
jgi:hypothetical protein